MRGAQRIGLIVAIGVLLAGGVAALATRKGASGCTRDVPLDIRAAIGSRVRTFGPGQSTKPGTFIGYDDGQRWYVRSLLDMSVSGVSVGSLASQDFVVQGGSGARKVTSIRPAAAFDVPVETDLGLAQRGFAKLQTCN